MTHKEAIHFIEDGIIIKGGIWADLGSGKGTFTKALSHLIGPNGLIYAIDLDPEVVELESISQEQDQAKVIGLNLDFTQNMELPQLDGILMANALHYVKEQEQFLKNTIPLLRHGGVFVLIEYDQQVGNPWVPYPVSLRKFSKMVEGLPLTKPMEINRRISAFGQGQMYLTISLADF